MKNENTSMENLKKIVKLRNKSLTSLAVELEVSQEAISQYISGKIKPKLSTIIKMASILNTSTDYLLGLTDNPNPADFVLSSEENNLINIYRKLDKNEKLKVDSYVLVMYDLNK